MLHPNPDMLLRIAQGDAYAAATEYYKVPRDQNVVNEVLKFEKYHAHPRHKSVPAGRYTDDGQMSIAVAEVLIEGPPFTKLKFADAFVRCFLRDKRMGYSASFQTFLEKIKSGKEFLDKINPESEKNGAAMRAVPIGVLNTPELVLNVAAMQAAITHNTPSGIFAAQAVALMSHFALYEEHSFSELQSYCEKYLPEFSFFTEAFEEAVTPPHVALKTVYAVLHVLRTQTNLIDILREIITLGGDTDSVAAIAWGIASTRMREPLPEFFEWGLETGRKYGVPFLRELGTRLMVATS